MSVIIFFVMCFIFAFGRGKFELYGLSLGVAFGLLFALFPLVYGFGQKVELTDKEISYSSSLLAVIISKFRKKLLLSEVDEIRLGISKFNKNNATFAAINISGKNDEISFNPDLFNNVTLQNLFQELKTQDPNIKLDNYALNLIEQGKDSGTFRKTVFGNFIWTALLIIVIETVSLLLFKLGIVSKEVVYIVTGLQIIIVLLIFNRLAKIIRKTRLEKA